MGAEGFGSLADAAHYIIFGGVLTLKLDLKRLVMLEISHIGYSGK